MKKNIIITLMSFILLTGVVESVFAQSEFIRNRYLRLGFHAKLWEFSLKMTQDFWRWHCR